MKNNSEKSRKTSTTMTTTTSPPSKKGKNKSSGGSGSGGSGSGSSGSGSNSEKPKKPQRGLGVAQLEKIRLHTQLASCGIIPPHPVGFLNSPYQHAPEDIRYQLEYQASLQQQPSPSPPPPPPPPQQPQPQPFYYPPSAIPPPYGYHHQPNNAMMGMRDNMERANNMEYAESHFRNTARWNPNNNGFIIPENNPNTHQPGMITRHLLSHVERPESNKIFESERANNENAEPSANDELDLELKL